MLFRSAPSEHTVNGKHFDLEMHIVHLEKHTNALGAVISIMFDVDEGGNASNAFIQSLSPEYIDDPHKFVCTDHEHQTGFYLAQDPVLLNKLVSKIRLNDVCFYEGSLTTPPCTEGVNWFLTSKVESISKEQLS